MSFNPNTFSPSRYARTFNALDPNAFVSPFFFMAAATTGVAGQVVAYDLTGDEETVTIADGIVGPSGVAGFLVQDVKDLDAGAVRGWRNLNNSTANLGDNVGVLQSNGVVETTSYNGTPVRGDVVALGPNGLLTTDHSTDPIGRVEATVDSVPASREPAQTSTAGGNSLIRVRVYGL